MTTASPVVPNRRCRNVKEQDISVYPWYCAHTSSYSQNGLLKQVPCAFGIYAEHRPWQQLIHNLGHMMKWHQPSVKSPPDRIVATPSGSVLFVMLSLVLPQRQSNTEASVLPPLASQTRLNLATPVLRYLLNLKHTRQCD